MTTEPQRQDARPAGPGHRLALLYHKSRETPQSPAAAGSGPAAGEKVNLNTATARELETLPGIGEKRAADIVADREANGPFRIAEDITRVKGIGEGTLAGLIDYITVE